MLREVGTITISTELILGGIRERNDAGFDNQLKAYHLLQNDESKLSLAFETHRSRPLMTADRCWERTTEGRKTHLDHPAAPAIHGL